MNTILIGIGLVLVLLVGTLLVMIFTGKFTSRPSYLKILPPEGTTFSGERVSLAFSIDYDEKASGRSFESSEVLVPTDAWKTNHARLRVPKRAKLVSVMAMYDNGSANSPHHLFWNREVQLPLMTSDGNPDKEMTAILLNFDMPGDPIGFTRKFNLQ